MNFVQNDNILILFLKFNVNVNLTGNMQYLHELKLSELFNIDDWVFKNQNNSLNWALN